MAGRTVVGLEITQHAVRAAEVRLGRKAVLTRFGEVALGSGAAHDSEVLDPGAVTEAVKRLRSSARLSSRHVVLGINSWRVLVREFSTPLTSRARIVESLPFEVQDLLPVSVDNATLDFYPTDVTDEGTHGLLVAAVSEGIETLLAAISAAGVHVTAVDLVPFGLARLAPLVAPRDEVVAMVHVGRHTTAITVVAQGVPRFVRMLPAEIPVIEEVPVEQPTAVDAGGGRLGRRRDLERAAIEREGQEAAEDLAARLRSTVQYYLGRGAVPPITRVRLSGAGSLHPAIPSRLRDALDVPVERIDPASFVRIRGSLPEPALLQDLVSTVSLTLGADR